MRLPGANSSRRLHPRTVLNGWLAVASTVRPDASVSRKTGLVPLGNAWVIVAGTMRQSSARLHTGTSRSPDAMSSPRVTSQFVSARRTRVWAVRHPDSRRSASIGRLSARSSSWRDSCDSATTGVSSSRASTLSRPADLGDLDLAVLGAVAALHELEVVDDDHAQLGVESVLQPSGLGPDLHHGQRRVVVDPQLALAQAADRLGDLGPVGVGETAVLQLAGVDPGLGCDEALGELEVAHLEGEEQHRPLFANRGVSGHSHGERGLAHGGSGPDDDRAPRAGARRAGCPDRCSPSASR